MNILRCLVAMTASLAGSVGGVALVAIGAGVLSEAIDIDAHSTIVFLGLALGIPLGSLIGIRVGSAMGFRLGSPSPRMRVVAGTLAFVIAIVGIIVLLATDRTGETIVVALGLTALEVGFVYASERQG
jgi:hypothetical protein